MPIKHRNESILKALWHKGQTDRRRAPYPHQRSAAAPRECASGAGRGRTGQPRLRPMGGGEPDAAGGATGRRGVASGSRWHVGPPRRLFLMPPAPPRPADVEPAAGGEWGVGGCHPAGRGSRCLRRRRRREGRSLPPSRLSRPSPLWRRVAPAPSSPRHAPPAAFPRTGRLPSLEPARSRRGARCSYGHFFPAPPPPRRRWLRSGSCPPRAAAVGSGRRRGCRELGGRRPLAERGLA